MLCLFPNNVVVLLCPTLLQADNVWPGACSGDLNPNFCETFIAEFRDEFQTPAIERQDPQA